MRALAFILAISKPYRLYLLAMIVPMVFVAFDANVKPYLVKTIIDTVDTHNDTSVWGIVVIYALMQAGIVLAWFFYDMCTGKISPAMKAHITQALLERLNLYSYRFFQEHLSGSLSSKISDVSTFVPQMIDTLFTQFFNITLLLMMGIFLLSRVHMGFGLAMMVWVSLFLSVGYVRLKKVAYLSKVTAEANSHVWGNVVDGITNMFTVKIFSASSYEKSRLTTKLEDYICKSESHYRFLRHYFAFQGSLFSIYILTCLVGMIHLRQNQLISAGDFALVFMLNFEIINRLFNMTMIVKNFITHLGTVDQALTILDEVPDISDAPNAVSLTLTQGEINFERVHFHYKGTEPLFSDKSVSIASAQKVGLVGYSGSGKTTFVHLILRLYDVTGGRILIDGQDIQGVTQESLHSAIAMIPQDPSLFHRSLLDNIRYGRLNAKNGDASLEEVVEAAKKAHAHDFIMQLPHGYNSLVGERGVKLSGGQRQRIAIARAFLKNAPILILDEATSQLDSVTEAVIQESLWELMEGKTTIVIAHRLSTLLHMDRILVFDKGRIVEDGTHEELLARGGMYKALWEAQVGGFLPEERV